jgi:hypothetical protein
MADEAAEAKALRRAVAEARGFVRDKVADAKAHALAALTESLKRTPEGRATAAKVKRSRSFAAAVSRLDELASILVTLGEDLRVETYRASWSHWRRVIPDDFLRRTSGEGPPQARLNRCRTALVHGFTLSSFLAGPIRKAKQSLPPALTVAGNRATASRDAGELLKAWASRTEKAITAAAISALVDGQTLADRMAGRDVIDPRYLEPDPSLPD